MDVDITGWLLGALAGSGWLVLGMAALLSSAGVPIPVGALLLAAGVLVREGALGWPAALVAGLAGAVLGDSLGFALGRRAGGWVQRRLGQRRAATWQKAQELFRQRGALAILVSRFLLTSLGVPMNLVAGSSHYGLRRLLVPEVVGRAIWLVLYGGLGYAFGSR